MARKVFRSPGGGDQDKAPWEGRTHPKVRAARRDAELAGKKPVVNRPADAVLAKLQRARGPRGADPPHPTTPPPAEPGTGTGGAAASARPSPKDFWASAVSQEHIPAVAPPQEFLSGGEDLFDPATGWDYAAITDSQIAAAGAPPEPAVAQPAVAAPEPSLDESAEFAVEIEDEPSAPAPITVDDALERAQALFKEERDAEALQLLGVASRLAPSDPRLTTWSEFGERRVMLRACPTAALDRIPRLGHPLGTLAQAARPDQLAVLQAVDGQTTAAAVRARIGAEPVAFWSTLGRLVERGWVVWSDDA